MPAIHQQYVHVSNWFFKSTLGFQDGPNAGNKKANYGGGLDPTTYGWDVSSSLKNTSIASPEHGTWITSIATKKRICDSYMVNPENDVHHQLPHPDDLQPWTTHITSHFFYSGLWSPFCWCCMPGEFRLPMCGTLETPRFPAAFSSAWSCCAGRCFLSLKQRVANGIAVSKRCITIFTYCTIPYQSQYE